MATTETVKQDKVLMQITRDYPRNDRTYSVGEAVEFPAHIAESMEAANPPFGKRISEQELEALTAPEGVNTPAAAPVSAPTPTRVRSEESATTKAATPPSV